MHYVELIKLQQDVSFILNFFCQAAEEITQSSEQFKIRLTSTIHERKVERVERVFQKLLKYFNGTATLTSFVFPVAGVFSCYIISCIISVTLPQTS